MKQFSGIANNIDSIIIGKVITKNKLFTNKQDLIFVTESPIIPKGYLAVITSSVINTDDSKCIVSNVRGVSELHDNDVVTIDSNGV